MKKGTQKESIKENKKRTLVAKEVWALPVPWHKVFIVLDIIFFELKTHGTLDAYAQQIFRSEGAWNIWSPAKSIN